MSDVILSITDCTMGTQARTGTWFQLYPKFQALTSKSI